MASAAPSIKPRTLPTIEHFDGKHRARIACAIADGHRVICQEKVDGSQLTIFKRDDELHFYNKNKPVGSGAKPFQNAIVSLACHPEWFQEGYYYHGEAMASSQPNTIRYHRHPSQFWIGYEIITQDGLAMTPEDCKTLLPHCEWVPVLYDSLSCDRFDPAQLLGDIEADRVPSILGGKPEGFVIKVFNSDHSCSRYKVVRPEFGEQNHSKKSKLPSLSDEQFIKSLGQIYAVEPRFQKAVQHLQERGQWNSNLKTNIGALVSELNDDLYKERIDDIKNELFVRFWPLIADQARTGLLEFIETLDQ